MQFSVRNRLLIPVCAGALAAAVTFAAPRKTLARDARSAESQEALLKQVENTIGAHGNFENGVLHVHLSRKDIRNVQGPRDATFSGAFEIDGDVFFQPLSGGDAFLNADFALQENETNPFIAALLKNGLVVQAFHQHFPTTPQVWFVHFRGKGQTLALAEEVRAALAVTSVTLPQSDPKPQTASLDKDKLAAILHGHASLGEDGVVNVWVYRKDRITIDGIDVNPQSNISTNIQFKPLGGSKADVVVDYSMTTREVDAVLNQMLNGSGWFQGCLYNQETGEQPQLYFDHMTKQGDAYELANQIRKGLDLTAAQ